jgi:hypothetical protein
MQSTIRTELKNKLRTSIRSPRPKRLSHTPSYEVSAKQLVNDYKANVVAADIKYKGNFFVVTGKIRTINKSFSDRVYIVLDDGSLFGGVYCNFLKDEESSVARLSKGQYVKVGGEVRGNSLGGVSLDRCRLQ